MTRQSAKKIALETVWRRWRHNLNDAIRAAGCLPRPRITSWPSMEAAKAALMEGAWFVQPDWVERPATPPVTPPPSTGFQKSSS
jgi:hypothetical protein